MKTSIADNYRHIDFTRLVNKIKSILAALSITILIFFGFPSCSQRDIPKDNAVSTVPLDSIVPQDTIITVYSPISLDSTLISPFFNTYPDLKKYEKDLVEIYHNHNFTYIWLDQKGIVVYGHSLYRKVKNIETEGVFSTFPYEVAIDSIFNENIKNAEEHPNAELLITSLYLYYFDEVYQGIDPKTTTDMGWLLPRKKISYTVLLDSIISDQKLQVQDSLNLFSQYYKLRDVLKRFRAIEQEGGWITIVTEPGHKTYKLNDTSEVILQIRNRLYVTGELKHNNESNVYDEELLGAVKSFQVHNGYKLDSLIRAEHIAALNIPVNEYIKKLVVNMERCRWVPPQVSTAEEFVFVNIPAFELKLYRNGIIELNSPVVVGRVMTKTVIFDGMMTYIVFSPYWNIPQSIINNEVIPGIEKDEDYLKKRNMDWNGGQVRQRPGRNNSLGLVKFMFPNSKSIYLHDSPAKSLFEREDRAMSHGCIRVAKARDLAIKILEGDEEWPIAKIDAAMDGRKETICTLKKELPVYIGYFTAWVDEQGDINFYNDVYKRDDRLAALLFYK